MSLRDELIDLERKFWSGDANFYRQNLDSTCLAAFSETAGTFDKHHISANIPDIQRWHDVSIEPKGMIEPIPGMAILTYEVKATRASGEPYAALVSSGYAKRGTSWKLAFHQQTPLTGKFRLSAERSAA